MTANISNTSDAKRLLGVAPDASLREAKTAFREIAKQLHPDCTPASHETLARLADAIAAIRFLETANPVIFDVILTEDEAQRGTLRALRKDGRSGVFKIPPGVRSGMEIEAVGDASLVLRLTVQADQMRQAKQEEARDSFMNEFVKTSPTARFAGWLRKARPAA